MFSPLASYDERSMQYEIDKLFEGLTPDLIGENNNESNSSPMTISNYEE